ncbi:site-specific integrase [Shewanella intestini]|uniref:Site-specific integrase n=1 Tax=Shewanella intestini TaxID=2017544 RepID=A0ABS5I4J9_9GAMM|nr:MULTISPECIES: site-specific integrase [Shewanella]MBR9728290.1 site-specific integrase [Shewanella intestini]MRG35755.1 tyrosine-type recombinase/integrase [Shewanella sp. XMDDZSB0408]
MKEVEAVKSRDTIKLISYLLKRHYGQQMADVWEIGLNLALRISDLLATRFSDIRGDKLCITEQKTGKQAKILLNDKTKSLIEAIRQRHPDHVYLFQSHRSHQVQRTEPKPLSRRAVTKAFAFVGEDIQLALGTHSMRKTRGYHLYQSCKDISRVMHMLRHQSEAVTLRYIGLTQQQVDNDFAQLEI